MGIENGLHLVVYLLLIYSTEPATGQAQLSGSSQTILAVAGDDVILPCHLEPATEVFNALIEWTKLSLDPPYVHIERDGRLFSSSQNPLYEYRTTLFTEELNKGNVSLKLFNVKLSDSGKYRCFLPVVKTQPEEVTIHLIVVTQPEISILGLTDSGLDLRCESKSCYPEPEVSWLDSDGNLLNAEPTETVRHPDGLYTVRSHVTVEKTDTNRVTCRIQQQNINQNTETVIHIPDKLFERRSPPVLVGTIIGLVLVSIIGVSAVVFLVYKLRLKTDKRQSSADLEKELQSQPLHREEKEEELRAEKHKTETLEKEKEELKQELEDLRKEKDEAEREKQDLRGQLEETKEDKEQVEQKLKQKEKQLKVKQNKTETLQNEKKELTERIQTMETANEELNRNKEKSEKEMGRRKLCADLEKEPQPLNRDEKEEELRAEKHKTETLEKEKEELKQELEDLRKEKDEAEREKQDLRGQLEKTKEDKEQVEEELKAKEENERRKIETLEEEKKELTEKIQRMETTNKELNRKKEKLEKEMGRKILGQPNKDPKQTETADEQNKTKDEDEGEDEDL